VLSSKSAQHAAPTAAASVQPTSAAPAAVNPLLTALQLQPQSTSQTEQHAAEQCAATSVPHCDDVTEPVSATSCKAGTTAATAPVAELSLQTPTTASGSSSGSGSTSSEFKAERAAKQLQRRQELKAAAAQRRADSFAQKQRDEAEQQRALAAAPPQPVFIAMQPLAGMSGLTGGGWRSDVSDMPARLQNVQRLLETLCQLVAPTRSMAPVELAQQLEAQMYITASSLAVYKDKNTWVSRLEQAFEAVSAKKRGDQLQQLQPTATSLALVASIAEPTSSESAACSCSSASH
jgi:hypothetical protein